MNFHIPLTASLASHARRFNSPAVDPARPFHVPSFLVRGAIFAVSLAAASYSMTNGLSLAPIIAFSALCLLGEAMSVSYSDRLVTSCTDMLFIALFVVLPASDAAAIVVLSTLISSLYLAPSLADAVSAAGAMSYLLLALGVITALDPQLSQPLQIVLACTTGFLVLRAAEALYILAAHIVSPERGSTVGARLSVTWAGMREGPLGAEGAVQTGAQLPMAVTAVAAYILSPWLLLMIIAPYMVAWRSQRQAARLLEATRQMRTDSMTGLANRARLFELADDELGFAQRYGHSVALIMGDLDNFKRVNDQLGHLAGDDVLRATAEAIRSVVDTSVFSVGRYGGEEFCILVPALPREEVLRLAERVREAVQTALGPWETTISLGIASAQTSDRFESLIDRADKALYAAKYAGKNRVHEWNTVAGRPIAVEAA